VESGARIEEINAGSWYAPMQQRVADLLHCSRVSQARLKEARQGLLSEIRLFWCRLSNDQPTAPPAREGGARPGWHSVVAKSRHYDEDSSINRKSGAKGRTQQGGFLGGG
jgi:hypothetical protein